MSNFLFEYTGNLLVWLYSEMTITNCCDLYFCVPVFRKAVKRLFFSNSGLNAQFNCILICLYLLVNHLMNPKAFSLINIL